MSSAISTEYAIKRCKNIGFIRTYNDAKKYCTQEQLTNAVILTDTEPDNIDENFINPIIIHDVDNITNIDPDKHVSIFIELAHEQDATQLEPIEIPVDEMSTVIATECKKYVQQLPNETDADKKIREKVKHRFDKYVINNKYFDDRMLQPYVLDALAYMYTHVHDTDFQESVLYNLRYNKYEKLEELLIEHPVEYHVVPIKLYPHTKPFEDIRIATNKNISSGNNNKKYSRKTSDYTNSEKVGNLIKLQAFSSSMFVVTHGKKCSFENASEYQNHEIVTSIGNNGILTLPFDTYDSNNLSFERLTKHLNKLSSFDIIFIHPNLAIPGIIADSPSDELRPSYDINSGEILSVAYRYITVNFFPYCKVYNEEIEQLGFII